MLILVNAESILLYMYQNIAEKEHNVTVFKGTLGESQGRKAMGLTRVMITLYDCQAAAG